MRAVITGEVGFQRHDGAISAEAEARLMLLIAVGGGAEEVLAPRLDPLDGPAEPARHGRNQDVLGIDVALDAEAPSHVGRDDPHVLLRHGEHGGDAAAHSEGHLGRAPDGEEAGGRIVGGEHAARLDRHAADAWVVEPHLHRDLGAGESAPGVAHVSLGDAREIARPVVVDLGRARGEGRFRRDRRGQRLVLDDDALDGVGGDVGRLGRHHRHPFAHVLDRARGEHGMVTGRKGRGGDQGRHGAAELGHVLAGEHGHDAGKAQRFPTVDLHEAGMGMRTADDAEP